MYRNTQTMAISRGGRMINAEDVVWLITGMVIFMLWERFRK